MENLDDLFVEMCAAEGDRGTGDVDSSVERLLEGAPLAARWNDISELLVRLLDRIANGDASARSVVAARLVSVTDGFGEGHLRTVQSAIRVKEAGTVDGDESVLHTVRGCEMLLRWSNLVARAERSAGGDPIRWCAGRNVPAHWAVRLTSPAR